MQPRERVPGPKLGPPSVLTLQLGRVDSRPDPDLPPSSQRDPQVPSAAGSMIVIYSRFG